MIIAGSLCQGMWPRRRYIVGVICLTAIVVIDGSRHTSFAQDQNVGNRNPTVKSLFVDFLHYSVLGRFDVADTFAQQLLDHPDLDPVEVLRLSEENERSIDTLLILVDNSTIGERAVRVLELIREGERTLRKDGDRILANIARLGGHPQAEYLATMHLVESGEYAVPWLVQTLQDEQRKNLWNRVMRALPQIGKAGVNPLVESLAVSDENVRETIIGTLGVVGYAQSVPYLLSVAHDDDVTSSVREAASAAIARIGERLGRRFGDSASRAFVALGEQFYDEHGSVAADPRMDTSNVWYWNADGQRLDAIEVPTAIFGPVMAMRCAERAMQLDPQDADAIALWIAANIRRESRLGFNVESGDPAETGISDPTRQADLPRALYFTGSMGPGYAQMVLQRAIQDRDPPVALGALAALNRVGGLAVVTGATTAGSAIPLALRFPDLVVRTRAAIAIGSALPESSFVNADLVVPTLANAMNLTERRNFLVIEPDAGQLQQVVDDLRDSDTNVIGEADVFTGLDRAAAEFNAVSAIFLSARVESPDARQALMAIRERYRFTLTPVVVLAAPEHEIWVEPMVEADPGAEFTVGATDRDTLLARVSEAAARVGMTPVDDDLAHELALLSTHALRRLSLDDRAFLRVESAERSAITALNASSEELQIAAVELLATMSTDGAQRAIASVALDGANTESLRTAAFAGLASSAKRFNNRLDAAQVDALLKFSFEEPNLRLRTAASQALGALNLAAEKAAVIPLRFHRG